MTTSYIQTIIPYPAQGKDVFKHIEVDLVPRTYEQYGGESG